MSELFSGVKEVEFEDFVVTFSPDSSSLEFWTSGDSVRLLIGCTSSRNRIVKLSPVCPVGVISNVKLLSRLQSISDFCYEVLQLYKIDGMSPLQLRQLLYLLRNVREVK